MAVDPPPPPASKSPTISRVALRYVTRFTCLAGDCKENCCSGLRVELTEENHRQLVARAASTPLRERVEALVKIERNSERGARGFAHIDAGGSRCPFLEPDWLCALHKHLGEDALPDPCSLFPRVLADVALDGSVVRELSATFACPEAARLCLTGEGAVDLVPFSPDAMAREIVVRRLDAGTRDPYQALLDDVRQVCLDALHIETLPVPVRLLLLVDLARRIDPFFFAGTRAEWEQSGDGTALRAELAATFAPERVADVAGRWRAAPLVDARPLRALADILLSRLPGCDNPRYHALVRPLVLADVDADNALLARYFHGDAAARAAVLDDDALVAAQRIARARLAGLHVHIDELARRYAVNAVVKDWYTLRPTLGSSLRRLVVRLALSLFCTRGVAGARASADLSDGVEDRAWFDDIAVDAFQIVAKNIEHAPAFMDLCERYLVEQHLDDVDGLGALLR